MASSTHVNGATEHEPDTDKLSNLERLILVQAVYEFGNSAWPEVSKLLGSHPMLSHSDQNFTPTFCNAVYLKLMRDAGLECPPATESRRAIVHRQLAKIHYDKRVEEVRALLLAEESKFRKIVGEIDDIRAGRWDRRILGENELVAPEDEPAPAPEPEETKEVEIITIDDDEPTIEVDESVEEPQATEQIAPNVQDGVVPKTDLEMQPIQDELSSAPEELPPKEAEDTEKDNIVEDIAPEPVEEMAAEELAASPQAEASSSREGSLVASLKDERMEEDRPIEDVQPEEIGEEITEIEKPETMDEAHLAPEEPSAPEVEVKSEDEPEPEVEGDVDVEAEAGGEGEVEMAQASDGEHSTRTDGKRKASEALSESHRERKRAREDSEPVDEDEPGPSTKNRRRAQAPDKKFQNVIGMLHSTISQHRYGNIFHNPIKKTEAPDYHDIVKRPMDLKTIKARVKDGLIANSLEFQRDIYLMFANAMMYNRPGSDVHNMAEEMMLESEIHINSFRQTEGFHRS
ncbi:hypothetical protein BC629DRAFT_716181 [Irpex lacteus]|nr:hypothetical protein BC629DRAFT_716181 [Irpex lacteus]